MNVHTERIADVPYLYLIAQGPHYGSHPPLLRTLTVAHKKQNLTKKGCLRCVTCFEWRGGRTSSESIPRKQAEWEPGLIIVLEMAWVTGVPRS